MAAALARLGPFLASIVTNPDVLSDLGSVGLDQLLDEGLGGFFKAQREDGGAVANGNPSTDSCCESEMGILLKSLIVSGHKEKLMLIDALKGQKPAVRRKIAKVLKKQAKKQAMKCE